MEEPIRYFTGSVGMGAEAYHNSETGAAAGVITEISGMAFSEVNEVNDHYEPLFYIQGTGTYNVLGGSQNGLVTSFQGDAHGGVGWQWLESDEKGCDMYFMGTADSAGSVYYNQDASNTIGGGIGVETGPMCRVSDDTLIMVSPVVGPRGILHDDIYDGGKLLAGSNWLAFGGRARVVRDDTFIVAAEFFANPSLKKYVDTSYGAWNTYQVGVDAQWQFSDKWGLHGNVKHTSYNADVPYSKDLSDTQISLVLTRLFYKGD